MAEKKKIEEATSAELEALANQILAEGKADASIEQFTLIEVAPESAAKKRGGKKSGNGYSSARNKRAQSRSCR